MDVFPDIYLARVIIMVIVIRLMVEIVLQYYSPCFISLLTSGLLSDNVTS